MEEQRVFMQDDEIFTDDHKAMRQTVRKFAESLAQ